MKNKMQLDLLAYRREIRRTTLESEIRTINKNIGEIRYYLRKSDFYF